MSVPVLILHAPGTNRDGDVAAAIQLCGGDPVIRPLTSLRQEKTDWLDFGMLVLPGGFSYGDALGAGRLWALDLATWFSDQIQVFVESGRPVIGICNGFQALVSAGVLPGGGRTATLAYNASNRFECRWIRLAAHPENSSPWLAGRPVVSCPVAHGEGRFLVEAGATLPGSQVAFCYCQSDGSLAGGAYPANPNGSPNDIRLAGGAYPANPNGSPNDIAGVTNPAGNVLGLMPHPEDHIFPYQHPAWTRGFQGESGLVLFQNGMKMA
jgi:phosphoribosylformylglycinamidine synthase